MFNLVVFRLLFIGYVYQKYINAIIKYGDKSLLTNGAGL